MAAACTWRCCAAASSTRAGRWPRPISADTEEQLEDPDGPSRAARNLLRAGFKQLSVRSVWRPPLPPEDEDHDDDDDYLDDDHDFELEGLIARARTVDVS